MCVFNQNSIWINSGLFLFFFSGLSYVMTTINSYHLIILIMGIVAIFIGTNFPTIWSINKDILGFCYLICAVFIGISYIKNQQSSVLTSSIGLILVWISVNIWIPSNNFIGIWHTSVYKILIIAYLICFIPSIPSFRLSRFSGVFRNPNGMGGAAVTFAAVLFSLLLYNIIEKKTSKKTVKWEVAGIIAAGFFSLCSTSRTALIAFLVMLILLFFITLYYGLWNKKIIFKMIIGIISLCFLSYILYHYTVLSDILTNITDKFMTHEGDQLNGRGEYWERILNRSSFFGNGEVTDIAAHNTFLSLLDQYGYIPCISWIGFNFFGLIKSLKIAFDRTYRSLYKFLPIFSFVCVVIQSMTEGMMLKTGMLLTVFCVSVIRYPEYF